MSSIRNVAVIGANGTLGPHVLAALLAAGAFTVTVLSRASSRSQYSAPIRVVTVPDGLDTASLTRALTGQDALVVTLAGTRTAEAMRLADACLAAGVRRFVPPDFGSCDSAEAATRALLPLYAGKARVRAHVAALADRSAGALSWTSLVTGHFFDYGLEHELLRFDVRRRTADLLDGGAARWSATNLHAVGLAVVAILQRPERTANRLLYIQSFNVSQRDVLAALERETGDAFEVTHSSAERVIGANRERAEAGDARAVEQIVSAHGLVAANWELTRTLSNEMLELPTESLEDTIRRVVSACK